MIANIVNINSDTLDSITALEKKFSEKAGKNIVLVAFSV